MNPQLRALGVSGLQTFPTEERIPIAPITLLFGPNSAGKSSVRDALSLFRKAWMQTPAEQAAEDWGLWKGPNRERALRTDWRLRLAAITLWEHFGLLAEFE